MRNDFSYQRPSKQQFIDGYAELIGMQSGSAIPMAITVVFRSSGCKPNPYKWLDEYKHGVLWKINKQLSRHPKELSFYHDLCHYEFGESSLYKSLADQRKPHHIHGIVFIPKNRIDKIWDSELSEITDRLKMDFDSISNVSSVYLEPLRADEEKSWLAYMSKGKSFYQH